jgi:hypothetical protein
MKNQRIDTCLESICNQGCRSVRSCIDALKAGRQPAETSALTPEERQELLHELEGIMAVYVDGCRL